VDGKPRYDGVRSFLTARGIDLPQGEESDPPAARDAGLKRAVVSSSANCREVLVAAGIEDLFQQRIDGLVAERDHLQGKPAPDTFIAGARALGVGPSEAAVFEDALAGVAAGRAGGFACVIGVDRVGQADELRAHGADVVVADLAELLNS
jgi:beta-phosphoglucomutase-like phosphatase (HAD superfamily)